MGKQQHKLTPEQDQELETMVLEMEEDGLKEADISKVVNNYMTDVSGKPAKQQSQDAPAAQDSGASSLEEFGSGLPTLEEEQRERQNKEAKIKRQGLAAVLKSAPGVGSIMGNERAVEIAAAFQSGVIGLAEGVGNFVTGTQFTIQDSLLSLFDPEYAQAVEENPELRSQLYDAMDVEFDNAPGELVTQYANSVTEDIGQGNWGQAGAQFVNQVAGAIPSLMVTATGIGGMAVLGASAAGSSFDETIAESPESGTLSIYGTSLLKGGYEMASEYFTRGILKKAGLVFGKGGKEGVEAYSKGVLKEIFKDYNIEGLSEAGASLAGHLTDYYVHGIPLPEKMMYQLADEYLVGGALGGGASSVGALNQVTKVKAEPKEKVEQDDQDAAVINTMMDAKKQAKSDQELSLIDKSIEEANTKIQERAKKHSDTVDDMTQTESTEVLENVVEAEKYETIVSTNPDLTDGARYVYTEKAAEHREIAQKRYEIVYEWPQTMQKANEIKEEIKAKEKEIKQKEATLAKSENPNPAATQKLNEQKAELKEKSEGLDKTLDEMRPTVAEAKIRVAKKKAISKAPSVERDATIAKNKEVNRALERAQSTKQDLDIITDPTIPEVQKERSWDSFFNTNKKTIDSLVYKSERKYGRSKGKQAVRAAIRQEVFDRLTTEKTEKGRTRKATYDLEKAEDRAKFWNAVDQAVNRKFQEETEGIQKIDDPDFIEEKAYFDDLLADQVINQDDYNTEIKNLRVKYGATTGKIGLEAKGEQADEAVINPYVEAAYRDANKRTGVDATKVIKEALEGTTVNKIFKDWRNNTEKLYKLLPPEYHSKAEFEKGNPPIEIWEQFLSDDASGRKRKSRLKRGINQWIEDSFGEGVDSNNLSEPDIMEGAFEFLESDKKKPDIKQFLPLLSRLKKNFPNTRIIISKTRMIDDFIEAGIDPAKADTVKGYTDGNVVVLNPDKLDLETPIHEYGHIWAQATRDGRPDLYKQAEKLIKKSPYYARIANQAKNEPDSVYYGMSEKRIVEESIAQGIGKAGEQMYDTTAEASAWDKLKKQIWEWINERLGTKAIEDLTLDHLLKVAVTEIITGEEFYKKSTYNDLEKSVISHLEDTGDRPKGADSETNEVIKSKSKVLHEIFNNPHIYSNASPYAKSKIDQDSRDILNATKRDFALRGDRLTDLELDQLILNLQELIENGNKTQVEKNKDIKNNRDKTKRSTATLIKETSGLDPEKVDQATLDRLSAEKKTFIQDIAKGNFHDAVARLLSPQSNNDFYGLLYDLMPKGKMRNKAKEFLHKTLTAPLEDANYNQAESARNVKRNFTQLVKKSKVSDKMFSGVTGVKVGGINLTGSQVVKVYNYIKNPQLYDQLKAGGVGINQMNEIMDYLDANPALKNLADGVPDIFAGSKALLNAKLDQHGYKGVAEPDMVLPGPGPELDVLARIYEGNIPTTAPYTPFTAVGADTSIDLDKIFEGDGNFYSVMSGNLKARSGKGAVRIMGSNLEQDINNYITGPLRTANYLDFARNANDVFSSKNLKAMEAAYGKEWGKSIKESLRTIITGTNRPSGATKTEQTIMNWLNRSVAGIMFFNVRSGVLQTLSLFNFAAENSVAVSKGISSWDDYWGAVGLIKDSAWYQERGAGKTGIEFEEIFGQESKSWGGRTVDKVLQAGYWLTQQGDKGAIAAGGAAFVAGRIKEGATKEQALKEFIALAEETQQSSRPERIGREQRSTFGRAVLAFANTPMQYNRKIQKSWKDMNAKGSTGEQKAAAAGRILYYAGLQNLFFTGFQQALWTAIDLEEGEWEGEEIENAFNSMLDSLLRGSGVYGAVVSVLKNTAIAVAKSNRPDQMAQKGLEGAVGLFPAARSKYQQYKKVVGKHRPLSDGEYSIPAWVTKSANVGQLTTNLPFDRLVKKLEALNDLTADDLSEGEKTLRILGWDRWALGAQESEKKNKTF